jgi:hypothetical protein
MVKTEYLNSSTQEITGIDNHNEAVRSIQKADTW